MPKSQDSYIKCKKCKKADVEFHSEPKATSCTYLKKVTCKNCGNNWFCCTFHQIKIPGTNVYEAMVHFDQEYHKANKKMKISSDNSNVCSFSTTNLTDINNVFFQRESMEKGNGIKHTVA